jgi:hypothetical protein
MEEKRWLNAKIVEQKMPPHEKVGRWLVAPTRQEKEQN